MEKEDALKAGHWVEPLRGMQLCGTAPGMKNAMAVRSAVEASDAISIAFTTFVCRTARTEYKRRLSERAMGLPKRGRSSASVSKLLGGC